MNEVVFEHQPTSTFCHEYFIKPLYRDDNRAGIAHTVCIASKSSTSRVDLLLAGRLLVWAAPRTSEKSLQQETRSESFWFGVVNLVRYSNIRFTPKGDQVQISPAASPEILHHTVGRTWLFIAYSDEGWLYYTNSHYLTYTFLFNPFTPKSDQCQISPAAPPEILHHTVRRTWLFIAYSDERWF